ncbi:MAG: hypothetical protein LRZ84_13785 [Desertifilum sp.]|nr:hypothetical protein [Desertifilum sp.]
MSANNSESSVVNHHLLNEPKAEDRNKSKGDARKKVLSRKDKLEAAKKANKAMMQAWKLISQRQNSEVDAESDV